MIRLGGFFVFAVLLTLSSVTAAESVLWEGFEGKNNWVMVEWRNSGRGSFEISKDDATEGSRSLKIVMNAEKKTDRDKVAVSREGYLDLTKAGSIVLDIFSETDDGLAVALGFDAGEKAAYYETQKKRLQKGWNKDVSFDLSGKNFKCEASDWKFERPLEGKENVAKLHVLIYRPSNVIARETVYIDNIRITGKEPM